MTSSGDINEKNIHPDAGYEVLPESYGAATAVLLPRDPNWMFAYWEITESSREEARRLYGADIFQKGRQTLRVYEAGSVISAGKYFDVQVMHDAKSWYINARESGGAYYCEVGFVLPDGFFISLVKSNTVSLPPDRVSEAVDKRRVTATGDFEKILQISGAGYAGKGSGEAVKSLAQRWEMLRALFALASSRGLEPIPRDGCQVSSRSGYLRLVADCELTVYGATAPGSVLSVSGREMSLNPDGTFSASFPMPDGVMELQIQSRNEINLEKINVKIARETGYDDKQQKRRP